MRTALRSVLTLFAVGCVNPMAHAADLANNLSQTIGGGTTVNTWTWPAQGFSTTATHFIIDSITVPLLKLSNADTGTVQLYIYTATGTGNKPGNSVTGSPVATISDTSMAVSSTEYTFSNLNLTLSPSTSYFLLLNAATGSAGNFRWSWTNSTSGTGFPSNWSISTDSGSSWSSLDLTGPQKMRIIAVPEPSTLALATFGSGILAGMARRQKSRKA